MSTPERDTVDTVEKLLTERRKVTGWLDALAGRRADTPPAVYQRVRDDYTAKLDKVQAKLLAASDAVQGLAIDVAGRLTDKEQALGVKQDERAEAELRAAVGEFSEREWDKRRSKLDDDITATTGERDALLGELTRLRGVLSEVLSTGAPVGDLPEAPVAASLDEPGSSPLSTDALRVTDAEPPSIAAFAPTDDALRGALATAFAPDPVVAPVADERASSATTPVVGIEVVAPPAPTVTPSIIIQEQSIIAAVEPAQPLAPSFDELAFLKAVVGRQTPQAPPMAAPLAGADAPVADDVHATFAVPEPYPDPMPEPRVSQEMTPPRESFFGRPTPRTSEAIKSLKCQECGTLNFPTEWYCERCGGELAAL